MILQALNAYYERSGYLPREGWVRRGVDYIMVLDTDGNCINIEPVGELKKGKTIPRGMLLPAIGKQAMKHTNSGKDANLLWDNASFVLGTGNKGVLKLACFADTLRIWLADCAEDSGVLAIRRFCESVQANPESVGVMLERFHVADEFSKRDPVLVFRLDSDVEGVHARSAVRSVYEKKRRMDEPETILGNCLMTGEQNVPIVLNETVIKNVWGSQSSGANIISFNKRSFESYGKRERNGENAPVSKGASFAYTTALNHLLTSPHRMQVGDASTVFWAEETHELEDLFGEVMRDDPDRGSDAIKALYHAVNSGKFAVGKSDARFYVLGLAAPSGGRITIRFWETVTAYELARRIAGHFDDIKIARAPHDQEHLSLFRQLTALAVQDKADNIPPNLGGEVMRAILEGLPYPASLLNLVVQRCRAEQKPTYARAATIKASLNRLIRRTNPKSSSPEKEFQVMLDPTNINPAYRFGRLFAVLEKIQEESAGGSGKLNATIRDRYYGAASSSPSTVFPMLLKLKNHHVSKLDERGQKMLYRAFSDNRPDDYIGQILNAVPDIPNHLALQDQGRFALGYYHQRQAFFTKSDTTTTNNQEESK